MLQIDDKLGSNLQTEIRKLKPTEVYNIAMLLSVNDEWKTLMSIVPKENVDVPKFSNEHIFMIEQASKIQQRNCAEIFLDEWGTMGRKRPTVEDLLNLLIKAGLFRAADYINISILKRGETERPKSGPAAKVENLSEIFEDTETETNFTKSESDYEKYLLETEILEDSLDIIINKENLPGSNEKLTKLDSNLSKLDEFSEEQNLDFDNKTTKMFDDIAARFSTLNESDLMKFDTRSDSFRVEGEKSMKLEAANENPGTLNNDNQNLEPKIPVFLADSTFSKESIEKADLKKNFDNLNISEDKTEEEKVVNVPKFLNSTNSDFSE